MTRAEEDAEKGHQPLPQNLYEVQNRDKTLFDAVELDSR
jgi:hypothetical protein